MQLELVDPTAYKTMMGLEKYLQQTSLDLACGIGQRTVVNSRAFMSQS